MKRVILIGLALAGCVDPQTANTRLQPMAEITTTRPEALAAMPLLTRGTTLGVCDHLAINRATATANDIAAYRAALRKRGLSARDVDLTLRAEQGTGMSFNGLSCSLGGVPRVNDSFIAGRHRWQAVAGSSYFYLEGDGTPEGMRVTGWN